MTATQQKRHAAHLKTDKSGIVPRYVRCYDDGGSADHYTVVYTRQGKAGHPYLGMSAAPFHPQGIGQYGESKTGQPIDRPHYAHLGKPISYRDLPEDCRRAVLQDYAELWNLSLDELLRILL